MPGNESTRTHMPRWSLFFAGLDSPRCASRTSEFVGPPNSLRDGVLGGDRRDAFIRHHLLWGSLLLSGSIAARAAGEQGVRRGHRLAGGPRRSAPGQKSSSEYLTEGFARSGTTYAGHPLDFGTVFPRRMPPDKLSNAHFCSGRHARRRSSTRGIVIDLHGSAHEIAPIPRGARQCGRSNGYGSSAC